MPLKNSPWAAASWSWVGRAWKERVHTSTGIWLVPHRAGIAHLPSPLGQVKVPCSSHSLLSTLHTCPSSHVHSHFYSSSWQLLCPHLPNNIRVLPLRNHQATACWLQETMPITGKCNPLPYLGQTAPTHMLCLLVQ